MSSAPQPHPSETTYQHLLEQLCQQLQQRVGHRLFTASYLAPGANSVTRIYSTAPDIYPVGGAKPVTDTDWTRQMRRGIAFVANRPQDFGPHFFDLDTIVGMGLGAVINLPVMRGATQIGSINLLDREGAYTADALARCQQLAPALLHAFEAYEQHLKQQA